jgi:hypothetical protein
MGKVKDILRQGAVAFPFSLPFSIPLRAFAAFALNALEAGRSLILHPCSSLRPLRQRF